MNEPVMTNEIIMKSTPKKMRGFESVFEDIAEESVSEIVFLLIELKGQMY